jgi:hypothetical protein
MQGTYRTCSCLRIVANAGPPRLVTAVSGTSVLHDGTLRPISNHITTSLFTRAIARVIMSLRGATHEIIFI